ncbi:ribosomal-processing cysteine protease Prp [Bacillus sp. FJAT-42376]|uniref:ribosomal-processing cysteine protease Prp n=1 Tax=Bacillus sp. FJAT-42376 TaxID=2014076 RepID=UPI000F4E71E0|nr:ribosomal-processing cysteine protease Prp [Bacillus sp. FJAT-42376]AZB43783.1 ribosomal-processing cysteine protease Prp [Bacillus sp. FJAT-42376]
MINVQVNRSAEGMIQSFSMSGHADFDETGKDLVCAGASCVVFGAINAIHALTGIEPVLEMDQKQGLVTFDWPDAVSEEALQKGQLLLEGMVVSIQTIEEQYGEYIRMTILKK